MNFLDLIKSKGYIVVSKELAKEIGLNETIILAELIGQNQYFKDRGELDEQGYFYCTIDKMEKNTTLDKNKQSYAINTLIKRDLIEKEIKGLPSKRYFKINETEITKLFFTHKDKIEDESQHKSEIEELYKSGYR